MNECHTVLISARNSSLSAHPKKKITANFSILSDDLEDDGMDPADGLEWESLYSSQFSLYFSHFLSPLPLSSSHSLSLSLSPLSLFHCLLLFLTLSLSLSLSFSLSFFFLVSLSFSVFIYCISRNFIGDLILALLEIEALQLAKIVYC